MVFYYRKQAVCLAMIFTLMFVCCIRPVFAGQKTYTIGVQFESKSFGGETKMIFEKCASIISQKYDFNIKTINLKDDAEWNEQTKNKALDFTGAHRNADPIINAMMRYGYKPFVSYKVFGIDQLRLCVFTDKKSSYKSLSDLKGKKILISPNRHDYYLLRDMLPEKPETFFGFLRADPNFSSFFYSLSLGTTDAIFNLETMYEFFKASNPGSVKNAMVIGCSKHYPPLFLMHSPNVPEKVVKVITDILKNAEKDEAFKEYRPLMKTTKLKFFPVELKDYKPILDLYENAEKKGWDKDYDKWLRMLGH